MSNSGSSTNDDAVCAYASLVAGPGDLLSAFPDVSCARRLESCRDIGRVAARNSYNTDNSCIVDIDLNVAILEVTENISHVCIEVSVLVSTGQLVLGTITESYAGSRSISSTSSSSRRQALNSEVYIPYFSCCY